MERWCRIKIKSRKGYEVSSTGRLKSLGSGRYIKTRVDYKGYVVVCLRDDGIKKNYQLHRLVAIAFIPNHKNKAQVNHKNRIRTDNNVENLEWMTRHENIAHALLGRKNRMPDFNTGLSQYMAQLIQFTAT